MNYEFNQDGYITVKYEISYINATFEEDRENMIGVCRMTGVEIECDGNIPDEIISEVKNQIFNHFASVDYFTENPDVEDDIINDIREYTGVSSVNVDW